MNIPNNVISSGLYAKLAEDAELLSLALQLHFSFDVGAAGFGLMSPPPQ
jgi:hypothetical protein